MPIHPSIRVYIILECACVGILAQCVLEKYVTQVSILLLYLITWLSHVITSYNKGIGTCVTYLTDSDTTKKCWYWPDTNTDTRIGAALKNCGLVRPIRSSPTYV